MSGGVRDSLAGVLAEHLIGYERRAYPSYVCRCGWDGAQGDDGGPNDGSNDNQDAALAHVAEQLERVVAEARAEALREHCAEVDDRALTVAEERGLAIGRAEVVAQVEAVLPGFEADYGIQSSPVARLRAVLRQAGGGE